MSKKRNANSPMESEKGKQKASTSAAASTLGVAAMLSAVSSVFSSTNNDSSSQASESEDEYSQATGGNSTITNDNITNDENPWTEENIRKSAVRSPGNEKPKPIFQSFRDGPMRDEIEIEIQTKNGKKFTGSITPLEIKYNIYINALKFPDHDNFDGARVGFRGKLVATIKLITPINIDELSDVEYFEFNRTTSIRGKQTQEVIGCKIKGVRWQPNTVSAFPNPTPDDERTVVKIEGCDYQVPEEQIITWLSHYGEIKSDLEEDLFKDTNETGGNNRTGNYSIMMILEHKIPQLLPMNGRRVKIYHKGIDKLCTKCFGVHRKSECKAEKKLAWIDHVRHFIATNDFIPKELFGRWNDLVKSTQKFSTEGQEDEPTEPAQSTSKSRTETTTPLPKTSPPEQQLAKSDSFKQNLQPRTEKVITARQVPPREVDYGIPTTETEYESMVERMATCGFSRTDLDKILETKKTAFNRATREYRNTEKNKTKICL